MTEPLCIYHGNCADGFTAAWVVKRVHPNAVFHAGFYRDPPPDVTSKIVYIVDFSYPRSTMEEIVKNAAKVIHIDHHETAIRAMDGYLHEKFESFYSPENTESGAMLCWSYFFPTVPVPDIIKHVDDRDRWKFKLEGTREIAANMFSYAYTFENWDMLMDQSLEQQILEGTAIQRRMVKDIKELSDVVVRRVIIAGHNVPCANVPYQFGSDMCSFLAKGEPFAAYYYDKPTHREFGLRSTPGGVNVAEIAESFGGGGHATASGFKRSFDEAREFEID
jgi:oligoribonuclease NrnB/cAMP/cGMP phosphodiesterase (DHH superfamily)